MKLQIKINKKPFNRVPIIGLLKACDISLGLKQAKDMVNEAISQDADDILEFDLPNGSLVNVNIHDYNPEGAFDIVAAQGDEIPDELNLIKKHKTVTKTDVLKPGTLVLIRDTANEKWELGIFSHYNDDEIDSPLYPYIVLGGDYYTECIPLEGNEHLLNTCNPANSSPVPEKPKEPTFDNKKKRYHIVFGNECTYFTDQELYNFITGAVLHNRDIGVFTVVDTERTISRRQIKTT